MGSCASAPWPTAASQRGDFFVTADDAQPAGPTGAARVQYFWQAFPTSSAESAERSTYMFTYLRPSAEMPSLLEIFEHYWRQLPAYQRIGARGAAEEGAAEGAAADPLAGLAVQRVLFGWFPTYRRNSPLRPRFDRVLSIGDASAIQSPLSFGGFCAMLRHLPRLTRGVDVALATGRLRRHDLSCLTPYLPNLGTSWMSVSAMTARPAAGGGGALQAAQPSPIVNRLLEGNFRVMGELPRSEALVFFRDVTTFKTLLAVLVGQTLTMAPLLPSVVAELGAAELAEFAFHMTALGVVSAAHSAATASGASAQAEAEAGRGLRRVCALDALAYGSGLEDRP